MLNCLPPVDNRYWAGSKVEFVVDNTIALDLNLLWGTRLKFYTELFNSLNTPKTLMFINGFDARFYQPIHKQFIIAVRLAGAISSGQAKVVYYAGGVDNWLVPRFKRRK